MAEERAEDQEANTAAPQGTITPAGSGQESEPVEEAEESVDWQARSQQYESQLKEEREGREKERQDVRSQRHNVLNQVERDRVMDEMRSGMNVLAEWASSSDSEVADKFTNAKAATQKKYQETLTEQQHADATRQIDSIRQQAEAVGKRYGINPDEHDAFRQARTEFLNAEKTLSPLDISHTERELSNAALKLAEAANQTTQAQNNQEDMDLGTGPSVSGTSKSQASLLESANSKAYSQRTPQENDAMKRAAGL